MFKKLIAVALALLIAFPAFATQQKLSAPTTGTLSGLTLVQDMNGALLSLANMNSGGSAPTTTSTGLSSLAGIFWHDTSTNTLKVRDAADTTWMILGYVDETGKTFTPHINAGQFYAPDTGAANAYVAAPAPAWTAYTAGEYFFATIANTNTGASTWNIAGLGTKAIQYNGSALTGGQLVAGRVYLFVYDGTQFQALGIAPPTPAVANANFSHLKASAPGLSQVVTVTADDVVMKDASQNGKIATALSVTGNLSTAGAGGLDTGSASPNTWYAIWIVLHSGTTPSVLMSLSATAPTMPSGDTFKVRVGWVRTDSSSNIDAFVQSGRRVRYVNSGSGLPLMGTGPAGASGIAGAALAVASFIPSTAASITVAVTTFNSIATVAPNANSGAYNTAFSSNPPPIALVTSSQPDNGVFDLIPESSFIFWYANNSNSLIWCYGWEDDL